ncbi:MAG: pantetheine-phosphate adenylyltransferase [Gemmatimonadetes bacterium]|nr:pantetheine-phosphate adenylyltransferase [Gemmatimonadota bacterium]
MSAKPTSRVAIYPGSFDPITYGHEDIIRRGLRFVDRIVVAVAQLSTQRKQPLFTIPERLELIAEVFADEPRVEARQFEGLLVDFAREQNAKLIIRGLRAVSDFEYEFQMALMNRQLWPEVETLFLAPDVRWSFLSASLVREIASLGGEVGDFVAPPVRARLMSKFRRSPARGRRP